jgi:hypothetical protein
MSSGGDGSSAEQAAAQQAPTTNPQQSVKRIDILRIL